MKKGLIFILLSLFLIALFPLVSSSCNENFGFCTLSENQKVTFSEGGQKYEVEIISVYNNKINFVKLNVSGEETKDLAKDEGQILNNGITINITQIDYNFSNNISSEVAFSYSKNIRNTSSNSSNSLVSSCNENLGVCVLYRGENVTFSLENKTFYVEVYKMFTNTSIAAQPDFVELKANKELTNSLMQGDVYNFSNGLTVKILDIPFEIGKSLSEVVFSYSSNENLCQNIGARKGTLYCGSDMSWKEQKKVPFKCQNHFECSSNICSENKCLSKSWIKKLLNRLRNFFKY